MPADVDQSILIDAYVRYGRLKGRKVLEDLFILALENTNNGVEITSVSFEGGSGSGVVNEISTAKLLVIVEQALQEIDGVVTSGRSTHMLFGGSILES